MLRCRSFGPSPMRLHDKNATSTRVIGDAACEGLDPANASPVVDGRSRGIHAPEGHALPPRLARPHCGPTAARLLDSSVPKDHLLELLGRLAVGNPDCDVLEHGDSFTPRHWRHGEAASVFAWLAGRDAVGARI
jgi:hypothetical protein